MAKCSKLKTIRPALAKEEFEDDDIISNISDDEDEEQHSKVLDVMSKLDGKKKLRILTRTEPISKINEHALVQVGSGNDQFVSQKVNVASVLEAITSNGKVGKALKKSQKQKKTMEAPLEKPLALRVQRTVGYEKVKEEVSKWDSVVKSNRRAEQLVFPLMQPAIDMPTTKEFSSKFKPTTPLEQQMSQLLRGSKHVQKEDEVLTAAEREALSSMSLKEALERRKELARIRVLQSYQEAKARRQNKIKSKKYHRLLKKEKMKNHLKEFESLKDEDPEGALEKLQLLEKRRVEERMTLKHKGAGKWAKLQAIRSKYDDEARDALAEQLRIGKEITRKVQPVEESDEEEAVVVSNKKTDNPWLQNGSSSSANVTTDADNTTGYRKLWNAINESKEIKRKMAKESVKAKEDDEEEEESDEEENGLGETAEGTEGESDVDEVNQVDEESDEEMKNKFSEEMDESLIRKKTLQDFAVSTSQPAVKRIKKTPPVQSIKPSNDPEKEIPSKKKKIEEIDPNAFITLPTVVLQSSIPETEQGNEEDEEEANERQMTLAEAFADDDVVEQFKEEKTRIVSASVPSAIDLTLPGWGEWGGTGLKISKRKKKRFIIKPPPAPKRKDENQGNLILNEDKAPSLRKQQVSELPHPFRSVSAFESTIRAPVTSTFVPQTAVRKLTEPKVITKVGTVIQPMTEDVLISTAKPEADSDEEDEKKPAPVRGKQRNNRSNTAAARAQKSKPYNKPLKKK